MQSLEKREELSEKIDAFVGRFSRLQDPIGEKLIPRFAALLGESPKSLLDILVFAEKLGWVSNAEAFVCARKLPPEGAVEPDTKFVSAMPNWSSVGRGVLPPFSTTKHRIYQCSVQKSVAMQPSQDIQLPSHMTA